MRTSLGDLIWYCLILLVIFTLIAVGMEFIVKTFEIIKQKRNKIAIDPKMKDLPSAQNLNQAEKLIEDEESNKIMDSAKESNNS